MTPGATYWFAIHSSCGASGQPWPRSLVGVPFEVVLNYATSKVLSWTIKSTGERFSQSPWPAKQLGVFRPPFKTRQQAQDYLDAPMVMLDEGGGSLNKISKSQQA